MAFRMHSVVLAITTAVMLWGLAGTTAQAQGTALVLMLRTGSEYSKDEVYELLEYSLKKLAKQAGMPVINEKEVGDKKEKVMDFTIKSVSAIEFQVYNRLISAEKNDKDEDLKLPTLTTNKNFELTQLIAPANAWQIKYNGKEPAGLTTVILWDSEDEKDTPVATMKHDGKNITRTGVATYMLKLPTAEMASSIKRFQLIFEPTEGAKLTFSDKWPATPNYYRIRLNGFRGNRKDLEKILKDENTPNFLQDINFGEEITLAVGDAQEYVDQPLDEKLDGNSLAVIVGRTDRSKPTRVWMLFPLKKEDVGKALKEFKNLPGQQVSKKIHESKNKKLAGEPLLITKGMEPLWIELPFIDKIGANPRLRPDAFGRVLPLANEKKEMVKKTDYEDLLKSFPEAHRLIVYEQAIEGETPTAIRYSVKKGGKRGFVHESSLSQWNVLLSQAAISADAPDKK